MVRFMVIGLWLSACPVSDGFAQIHTEVLADFKTQLGKLDSYSEDQQNQAVALLESLVSEDPSSSETIGTVLESLDDDFATGAKAYRDGNLDAAIAKLRPLAESTDSFLAAEVRFHLAKCFAEQEDHEAALSFLQDDASATSLRSGDSLFLRGVCQAKLLQRDEAIETFAEFMRSYPQASERQRIAAWRQLEMLSLVEEGTLTDIYQKMDYARRRLARAQANEPTQVRQKETITVLDALIKEAEEREAISESESDKESEGSKSAKAKGKGGGKEGPGGGADDKTPMKTVRQIQQGTEATPWDHLRDKKRDAKALAAIKDKYPARYRALIEQYYRSLQDETER